MIVQRRKSKQRDRIYGIIKASPDHPTAQMIYEALKKEIKSTSMGNVYRNIRILIEQGLVASRNFGDGMERFDAITRTHYHFICEKCKSVSDFMMPVQESITKSAQKKTSHTITGHTIQFYGICDSCRKKNKA